MNFSKEIFKKIWEASLPYQDKRDDAGHAEIVTKFAIKLCELEGADADIVIPAAILHDIGWSQLSDGDRFRMFNKDISEKELLEMRDWHQIEGVKLAKEILKKVYYPEKSIDQVLEIISQHDTRKGFFSREDGIMRDADKLWCFSETGLSADKRRREEGFPEYFEELERNIDSAGFFFSLSAKDIALKDLKENIKKIY